MGESLAEDGAWKGNREMRGRKGEEEKEKEKEKEREFLMSLVSQEDKDAFMKDIRAFTK